MVCGKVCKYTYIDTERIVVNRFQTNGKVQVVPLGVIREAQWVARQVPDPHYNNFSMGLDIIYTHISTYYGYQWIANDWSNPLQMAVKHAIGIHHWKSESEDGIRNANILKQCALRFPDFESDWEFALGYNKYDGWFTGRLLNSVHGPLTPDLVYELAQSP